MRYSFYRNELQYINKHIFSNKLKGVPKNKLPLLCVKNRLYRTDVIDFDKNKKPFVESVYQPLFQDWSNANKIIKFKTEFDEIDVIVFDDSHIVTIEEDGYCCDVGYFLYEEVGLRNYILKKLNANMHFSQQDENIGLRLVFTEDEFERFMDIDEMYLTTLSEKLNIHKSVFKKMVGHLLQTNMVKMFGTYNETTKIATASCVYTGKTCNYIYKKILGKNINQYIVSICDTETLIKEIMQGN